VKIRFGIQPAPADPPMDLVKGARQAESAGFEAIGSGAHGFWPCTSTLLALNTQTVIFGPRIIEPVTHHPTIDASGASAVAHLAPGRFFLGFGTGDSAVYQAGLKPATVDYLEEHIVAVKGLLAGRTVTYQGREIYVRAPPTPVPIYVAGSGPKVLRMAGKVADGVICNVGLIPEAITSAHAWLSEGAAAAGRSLDDIDVWFYASGAVHQDRDRALNEVKTIVAASFNMSFRFTQQEKHLPIELSDRVEELKHRYDSRYHVTWGAGNRNAELMDELGLTEYGMERFAIAGNPQDCRERIDHAARAGARQIWLTHFVLEDTYPLWRDEIVPAFQ
jgi:5,10-methylenetetrahydromethanopterin reductase